MSKQFSVPGGAPHRKALKRIIDETKTTFIAVFQRFSDKTIKGRRKKLL
jgi:hypothetical protein